MTRRHRIVSGTDPNRHPQRLLRFFLDCTRHIAQRGEKDFGRPNRSVQQAMLAAPVCATDACQGTNQTASGVLNRSRNLDSAELLWWGDSNVLVTLFCSIG